MPNDYYTAADVPRRFGVASSERERARFEGIEAGFDRLPTEDRLKRGLVGTGEDTSTDPDTIAVVTGDVPFGSYSSYAIGQLTGWIATARNTGAAVISVDGGPIVPLLDSGLNALPPGHLIEGAFIRARFTGSAFSVTEATATIRPGGEGAAFTREQIVTLIRQVIEGGAGAAEVLTDVERVSSEAELDALSVVRRWLCVVVTAPFEAGGVSYTTDQILIWDNQQDPAGWVVIYTPPPRQVQPREGEPLGALVSPQARATLALLFHVTEAGHRLVGTWRPEVAPTLSFSDLKTAAQRTFGLFSPVVAGGLEFSDEKTTAQRTFGTFSPVVAGGLNFTNR